MKTTLPEMLYPLMHVQSLKLDYCAICRRHEPLNDHHMVRRSAGVLIENGKELEKPTITLCGFGNHLTDADGRYFCHGLAHAQRLHFRAINGEIYYRLFDKPTPYMEALDMDGWKKVKVRARA